MGYGGKGKGKWVWQGKGTGPPPPPALPEGFEIDPEARFTGTVSTYHKWQGYGFIKPNKEGVVPNEKLYVHWSNIQSSDRFPFLLQEQEVEFGLMKWTQAGRTTLRAKTVTLPGGKLVAVQDEVDAQKKQFVGGQMLRYTGKLKFYNPRQAFGYVVLDDGFQLEEAVPKELRVEESEVNAGGRRPQVWMENIDVEFGIVKNKRGQYLAYNMTLPGGAPLLRDTLEHRQPLGGARYPGTIAYFNWQKGWGLITPDPATPLPGEVAQKLVEQQEAIRAKGKEPTGPALYFRRADVARGTKLDKDQALTFSVYIDDNGAGACDVQEVDA